MHRRFELIRDEDVSGLSGTGVVVEGVLWTDGTVSTRWRGVVHSFGNWNSMENVVAVHGHQGKTWVNWLDAEEAATPS